MKIRRVRGIIFDMDNTLLRSRIDFGAIKDELFDYFVLEQLLPAETDIAEHTASTLIEKMNRSGKMTAAQKQTMWELVRRHEVAGMKGADLEPGVRELLQQLRGRYMLAVVTNNAVEAAERALRENGIYDEFEHVVGRESVNAMKPAPDAFLYVLEQNPDIPAEEWISVGDAWIDGKASMAAGIRFIAYQGNSELMNRRGVDPAAHIQEIQQLLDYI